MFDRDLVADYNEAQERGGFELYRTREIRQLLALGLSIAEAASTLGVAINTICRQLMRANAEQVLEAERLLLYTDDSQRSIAIATKLSDDQVDRLANAMGCTRENTRWTPEMADQLRGLCESGLTLAHAAEALGVRLGGARSQRARMRRNGEWL